MSKTRVEFFATPDEQLCWFRELLADGDIWCVVRRFPPNWKIEHVMGTRFLDELKLTKPDEIGGLQLFFGQTDLVPTPIWLTTVDGKCDIDFTRSQAIQYDPSILVGDHILLEGQMGIMHRVQYEEVGIDPKPIRKWFGQVAQSFNNMNVANGVVLRDPARSIEKEYPDIVATRGAIQWQRSGHLLKQFVKGAYEFDIRVSN